MDCKHTKAHRLTKAAEFSHVFEHNTLKAQSRQLLMLALTSDASSARLGLVVSKKNVGCAVARNRIKRLCREAFRRQRASLPALDILILAKPGISHLDNGNIDALLVQLFDKLRTLHVNNSKHVVVIPDKEALHDQKPA